jgi:hypothetical protein
MREGAGRPGVEEAAQAKTIRSWQVYSSRHQGCIYGWRKLLRPRPSAPAERIVRAEETGHADADPIRGQVKDGLEEAELAAT